jgi:RNA polymerase sigma factor (sigma-70 family)
MDSKQGQSRFATTHWTVVLAAGDRSSPDYTRALNALCETYWYPLYAYLRRRGYDVSQAEDYTQGFFVSLLEGQGIAKADPAQGRFRSFLLAALKNYLADEWGRSHAQKRGGRVKFCSLDLAEGETRYGREPVDGFSAEKLFERSWAQAVLAQAMTRLKAEWGTADKQPVFEHLKRYLAAEGDTTSYHDTARQVGMTEGAVKVAVHRLRRRYGMLVREEIARTVTRAEEVDDELNALWAALAEQSADFL